MKLKQKLYILSPVAAAYFVAFIIDLYLANRPTNGGEDLSWFSIFGLQILIVANVLAGLIVTLPVYLVTRYVLKKSYKIESIWVVCIVATAPYFAAIALASAFGNL